MKEQNCDVVYGVQRSRKGGWFERISGEAFYKIFRLLTGVNQPNNIITARLMNSRYKMALTAHNEREVNIGGLWITTGFEQIGHFVKKHSKSPTSYSFLRKMSHFINAITSFSNTPLVFIFYFGLIISFFSSLYILFLLYQYLFIATPPEGYASIIASIWLLSGLIIFFIGIIGIYLSKVFMEVKQRPYTIIKEIFKNKNLAK
jgi:putative glycosyltransferase